MEIVCHLLVLSLTRSTLALPFRARIIAVGCSPDPRGTTPSSIPSCERLDASGGELKICAAPARPITVRVFLTGFLISDNTALAPLTGLPQRAAITPLGRFITVSGFPVKSFNCVRTLLGMYDAAVYVLLT